MSDDSRGYLWLRSGSWVGWTEAAPDVRVQSSFSPQDQNTCRDALISVIKEVDPAKALIDWVLVQGDLDRKERYEQWTQDPADDFLANLQTHIENDRESNYYYKLISERPVKKVEYIVGSFRVPVVLEKMVEDELPRSSRLRWVPFGYLATQGDDINKDPIIVVISATQTVALCMEAGSIRDIRVFQFSVDRCMEQLRRDHFSENQARQFLEMEFSFSTYHKQDRILSLKIEVDQFLEDLTRLFLSRLHREDQPIWIAADVFAHHEAQKAFKSLTSNPVSLLSEKDWVYRGASNWSHHQERFLQVPHKKKSLTLKLPPIKNKKSLVMPLIILFVIATALGYVALRRHVSDQIATISRVHDALILTRTQWLEKMHAIPNGAKTLSRMELFRDQVQNIKKGILP